MVWKALELERMVWKTLEIEKMVWCGTFHNFEDVVRAF